MCIEEGVGGKDRGGNDDVMHLIQFFIIFK